MSKITGTDNVQNIIIKMSEGNIGAVNVLMGIITRGEKIDPGNFMGGLGYVLLLDTFEIYGSSIWVLYKDVCGEDIVKMLAVIRATQLGLFSSYTGNYIQLGPNDIEIRILGGSK